MGVYISSPFKSLDGAIATGGGGAFGGLCADAVTVQVVGIVSGDTVDIEVSNDGVNWETDGSTITADGVASLTPGFAYYRANLTAIAGGGAVSAIFAHA